jgi:ATP-dependent RNA helicase DeaD
VVPDKKEKKPQNDKQKLQNKAQKGYRRLFINLGKRDGFYPGELMQTLNRFVGGRQEVGHIDLLDTISYFEVPEKDARKVMIQLTGIRHKGRTVRCNDADKQAVSDVYISSPERKHHRPKVNDADEGGKPRDTVPSPTREKRGRRDSQPRRQKEEKPSRQKKDDWRALMHSAEGRSQGKNKGPRDLKGPEPDFSEEGWAMRKPRKKKK